VYKKCKTLIVFYIFIKQAAEKLTRKVPAWHKGIFMQLLVAVWFPTLQSAGELTHFQLRKAKTRQFIYLKEGTRLVTASEQIKASRHYQYYHQKLWNVCRNFSFPYVNYTIKKKRNVKALLHLATFCCSADTVAMNLVHRIVVMFSPLEEVNGLYSQASVCTSCLNLYDILC